MGNSATKDGGGYDPYMDTRTTPGAPGSFRFSTEAGEGDGARYKSEESPGVDGDGMDVEQKEHAEDDVVPTVFRWEHGGRQVYITGTFNNWEKQIPMHCFPVSDHQLLTSEGWMFYSEVRDRILDSRRPELLLASYSADTDELVYERPRFIVYNPVEKQQFIEFSGKDVQWDGGEGEIEEENWGLAKRANQAREFSLLTTPNHDVYVSEAGYSSGSVSGSPPSSCSITWCDRKRKVKAKSLLEDPKLASVKFLSCAIAGVARPLTELNGTSDGYHLPFMPVLCIHLEEEVLAFLELYGYWLGDGLFGNTSVCSSEPSVAFSLKNGATDEAWLASHLNTLRLKRDVDYCIEYMEGIRGQVLHIKNPAWVGYFVGRYGDLHEDWSRRKFLLYEDAQSQQIFSATLSLSERAFALEQEKVARTTVAAAKRFWQWVWTRACHSVRARAILSGASFAGGGVIRTKSVQFRGEIEHLAMRAGFSASFYRVSGGSGGGADYIKGGMGGSDSASWRSSGDHWAVHVSLDEDLQVVDRLQGGMKMKERNDASWCATMPSGYVIVRRARRCSEGTVDRASIPTIQGNCSGNDFTYIHDLKKGKHAFKFIVDDEWRFAPDQPTVADIEGRVNNFIDVSDFHPYTGEDDFQTTSRKEESDEAYSQFTLDLDEYTKEPPPLPPHLRHIIMNKNPPVRSSDPSALPVPQHVALNHLYCTAIKDGVMVLGMTQRYKSKFVTTVYYSAP